MSRHLLLGGAGFIGRHVAAALLARGEEVVLAGRREPDVLPVDAPFRRLDLAHLDWEAALADCDVVHHYAWSSIPQTAADDPLGDLDQHVRPLLRLLDAARRLGGRRIVFASSGGTVYGRIPHPPAREDDACRPIAAYGAAKLAAETYLRVHHLAGGVDARVARLSNPYGAGQDVRRPQGAVSVFIHKAVSGEPLTVWGDGEVVRDYLHVTDAAEALAELAVRDLPGSDMPLVNVGSGVGHSLNAVVDVIQGALGRPVAVERLPARPFDVPVNVLDIARASAVLDWSPRLSLEQGVRRTIDDLRAAHA